MDKRSVRSFMNGEKATETQIRIMYKVMEVILRWSGYDGGYWQISEIAQDLRINKNTVYNQLKLFKQYFPEGYEKAKEQREMVKRVSDREYEGSRRPKSWDKLKDEHGDEIENHIEEKF